GAGGFHRRGTAFRAQRRGRRRPGVRRLRAPPDRSGGHAKGGPECRPGQTDGGLPAAPLQPDPAPSRVVRLGAQRGRPGGPDRHLPGAGGPDPGRYGAVDRGGPEKTGAPRHAFYRAKRGCAGVPARRGRGRGPGRDHGRGEHLADRRADPQGSAREKNLKMTGTMIKVGNVEVIENYALAPFTSFKVGGPADYFAEAGTLEGLRGLLAWAREKGVPFFMLGRGTNLLIRDGGIRGLVIRLGG